MESTGLYLHIPFCVQKCAYCDFVSASGDESAMGAYLDALLREIALRSDPALPVDTVYFGGGTPTHFGAGRLADLLAALRESFSLLPGCEITCEANPESVTSGGLDTLRKAGFNRLSLGVQSFADSDLRALGRVHTAADAVRAVENARAAGFENLSIDLIFGLPDQTMAAWEANLTRALTLPVTHLSCYGLIPEPGTPLVASPLMDRLPDDDAQADMYLRCVDMLAGAGFEQYEISNFARGGMVSRHNLRYWQVRPYLGLGAAAHGDFGGYRTQNYADRNRYVEALQAGRLPVECAEKISPAERVRERVMLGLRTAGGIGADLFPDREGFFALARGLDSRGLGTLRGESFSLTPEGFLLSNAVIGEFWGLLDEN